MKRAIDLYKDYLNGGGDPNLIKDVQQLLDMEREAMIKSFENKKSVKINYK